MLISWGFHDLSITKEWWLNRSPQSYGDIGMIIGMILKMEGVFFPGVGGCFSLRDMSPSTNNHGKT